MRLLTPANYTGMPWKNGLGSTLEIFRADTANGEMDWRVSIASVTTDGPFSNFAGYDRHIMVIEGAGMVLEGGPQGTIDLRPCSPQPFSGDWPIRGKLRDGPVRDFNLLSRREAWVSRMEMVRFDVPRHVGAEGEISFVYVLNGGFESREMLVLAGHALLMSLESPVLLSPQEGGCSAVACFLRPK